MRLSLLLLLVVGLVLTSLVAADQNDTNAWKGAHRDDVVAILGQPNKAKKSGDGEVLQYKLFRMHVDSRPGPGVLLIEVPGLGLVGRPSDEFDPFEGQSIAVEPSEIDGEGHLVAGGLSTTHSASGEWSKKAGGIDGPHAPARHPVLGKKVKLKFKLNADGRVVDWTVSGK